MTKLGQSRGQETLTPTPIRAEPVETSAKIRAGSDRTYTDPQSIRRSKLANLPKRNTSTLIKVLRGGLVNVINSPNRAYLRDID
ncbi:hypothetical protein J6590_035432 [Homalodisca vitripennis]|nr:hypothetical protein J6590_035432 [Homalodisca vitripennis]